MLLSWFLIGKVPRNGFCDISVNKILKMTSQYNTSLVSLRNYFFPGIFRVVVAPTPFALQYAPNSDSYQVNSTSSNVMFSGFIFNSSFTNCSFQFSSKWCESFTRMNSRVVDGKMASIISGIALVGGCQGNFLCYCAVKFQWFFFLLTLMVENQWFSFYIWKFWLIYILPLIKL